MKEELNNLKNNALAQIIDAKDVDNLEELRITYLGRNGSINELTKEIKKLENEEKREIGILINETKKTIEETLNIKEKELIQESIKVISYFDPTIPGIKYKNGHLHPTSQVIEEMFNIFRHLGFSICEGPEIES